MRADYFPLTETKPCWRLYPMPLMNYAFFEFNWWEQALFPALSMHQELFWNNFTCFFFFLQLQWLNHTRAHISILCWILGTCPEEEERGIFTDLGSSVLGNLSSLVLWSKLGLIRILAASTLLKEVHWDLPGYPLPMPWPGKFSQSTVDPWVTWLLMLTWENRSLQMKSHV